MIVTLDDYRGATGPSNSEQPNTENDEAKFTVAKAGHLKVKLQALNNILKRNPLDRHGDLDLDDVVHGALPRTYVNGSEDVYFTVKHLPWPSKIPDVFASAYSDVVRSRLFTNKYIPRPSRREGLKCYGLVSTQFAPTFSSIRPLLPEIDALCNTSLSEFFEEADKKTKPFPFMRLPAELRLQIYDHLVPNKAFVRVQSKKAFQVVQRPPVRLDLVRASRALHEEATKHFFHRSTLLIEACEEPRRHRDHVCYTRSTADEYATLIASMSAEVRQNFTHLEIQIRSDIQDVDPDIVYAHLSASPLRRICTALPNLEVVVISFQRVEEWSKTTLLSPTFRGTHVNSLTYTLEWLHAQLPDEGLRIAWDLTHFRCPFEDAAQLRRKLMSEKMIRESVERDGTLELKQSATATREDLQKWSEMRDLVREAFPQS